MKSKIQLKRLFSLSTVLVCALYLQAQTTYTSSGTCLNLPFPSNQTGTFETTFKATPQNAGVDVVMGMSNNANATGAANMSASIRFHFDGIILGRHGGAWHYPATAVPWTPNTEYTFRFVVNVPENTFAVYVTPAGGQEVSIGNKLDFRVEVDNLNHWHMVNIEGKGTVIASDFVISSPNSIKNTKAENGSNLSAYTTASNQMKINYTLNQSGKAALSLYDITGKLVKTIENSYKESGAYEKFCDISELSKGVYFIELNVNGRRDSFKLIK